jgi:hypothetical protein
MAWLLGKVNPFAQAAIIIPIKITLIPPRERWQRRIVWTIAPSDVAPETKWLQFRLDKWSFWQGSSQKRLHLTGNWTIRKSHNAR